MKKNKIAQSTVTVETRNQIVDPPIFNLPMNDEFVIPPAHLWSRIENVLDEQDKMNML